MVWGMFFWYSPSALIIVKNTMNQPKYASIHQSTISTPINELFSLRMMVSTSRTIGDVTDLIVCVYGQKRTKMSLPYTFGRQIAELKPNRESVRHFIRAVRAMILNHITQYSWTETGVGITEHPSKHFQEPNWQSSCTSRIDSNCKIQLFWLSTGGHINVSDLCNVYIFNISPFITLFCFIRYLILYYFVYLKEY